MPIRPIDIVSIAPKSQEAANQQLANQQRASQSQTNMQNQFQQHIRNSSEQVVHAAKGENKEYRYDAKEKGNGSYSRQQGKKKKKDEDAEKSSNDKVVTSSFDIKI